MTAIPTGRFCEACAKREAYRGYTLPQLHDAFDSVKNAEHWKNPIDKVVPYLTPKERALIHAAVIFFAGCEPKFEVLSTRKHRVTAVGYFAAVGA